MKTDKHDTFVPRTVLGKRLVAIRRKAIKFGMKLLSEDGVLAEVARRRKGDRR